MGQFAQLLQAVAALLWPLFAFVALFAFRTQISELLTRLKKGKLLGQEIELDESLVRLDHSATAIEREVAALPASTTGAAESTVDAADEAVKRIVADAAHSPKAALMMLASEVEKEARHILAGTGLLKGRVYVPLSKAIEELDRQYGGLPTHVSGALKLFWEVRSRLIHGRDASEEDILRAIDSGVTILKALQALPQEINVVHHPGVDIFSDPEGKNPVVGAKGVILEASSPGGTRRRFSIFPTTRSHFHKGKRVAWEWNHSAQWGPTWYRDPETGVLRQAWEGSLEFIGSHMDDI